MTDQHGGGSSSNRTGNSSGSNTSSNKKVDKKSKIEPQVVSTGDGTADDVIRAHVSYIPGAESVQIQVAYWDEVKAYHTKSIELDADEIAEVFTVFMKNLCSNCKPTYRYMETAESAKTRKEGRASSNKYTGATGISKSDRIYELTQEIIKALDNGESMDYISELTAKRQELIDEEVEELIPYKNGTIQKRT